jgi:hypothetical protein
MLIEIVRFVAFALAIYMSSVTVQQDMLSYKGMDVKSTLPTILAALSWATVYILH